MPAGRADPPADRRYPPRGPGPAYDDGWGKGPWPVPNLPYAVTVVLLVFTALNFAAPFMVEPGTVRGLDGGANRIDYAEQWEEMSPLPRALYWFGDFNCHQKEDRTVILNDNQMPFCARDAGMFLGMTAGSFVMAWATPRWSMSETSVSMLPRGLREAGTRRLGPALFAALFWGLFVVPMGFDGTYQLVSSYESTNLLRLVTGFLGGVAVGVILLSPIISAMAPFENDG